MEAHDLVDEVLREWESNVNRVAKRDVGDKMIVWGGAARWWDNEKITLRQKCIRRVGKVCGISTVDYVERSRTRSLPFGMRLLGK